MNLVRSIAAFAHDAHYGQLSPQAAIQLKIRVLDALAVAIGAPDPARRPGTTASQGISTDAHGVPRPQHSLDSLLLRPQLDFGDVYLGRGGICRPSATIAPVLLAAGRAKTTGRELLVALAVAYEIQTRLADTAGDASLRTMNPVRRDWAVQAALGKLRGLDVSTIADAIARINPEDRAAGQTVAAHPDSALAEDHHQAGAGFAATSPSIDWSGEGLEGVLGTVTRMHYADVRAQSAIEVALTLATPPVFPPCEYVRAVRVRTFQAACDALAGDDDTGARHHVQSVREAACSLPYMVAVALLDQRVQPAQYALPRILRADVQTLLHKVSVAPHPAHTAAFPEAMPAQVDIELTDGTSYCASTLSCNGSPLRPWDWPAACRKFRSLVAHCVPDEVAAQIAWRVQQLDSIDASELTALLATVSSRLPPGDDLKMVDLPGSVMSGRRSGGALEATVHLT